jgi:hypothetical protein
MSQSVVCRLGAGAPQEMRRRDPTNLSHTPSPLVVDSPPFLNAVSDHGIDRSSGAPSLRSRALCPCGADARPGPRLVSGKRRPRPRGAGPWPVWSLRPSRRRVDRATSMQVDETAYRGAIVGFTCLEIAPSGVFEGVGGVETGVEFEIRWLAPLTPGVDPRNRRVSPSSRRGGRPSRSVGMRHPGRVSTLGSRGLPP